MDPIGSNGSKWLGFHSRTGKNIVLLNVNSFVKESVHHVDVRTALLLSFALKAHEKLILLFMRVMTEQLTE